MKKAQYFYDQMNDQEKEEYKLEMKHQRPHILLSEWLEKMEFKTFERFLDKSFDHRMFIKGTNRLKYTYWFNVMTKYNVSNPTNFEEL